MNTSVVMNCTPHPVRLTEDLFSDGHVIVLTRDESPKRAIPDGAGLLSLPSSGFRLAATPQTSGPRLGCDVAFVPSADGMAEVTKIKNIFSNHQGVDQIVVASEISVRAFGDALFDPDGGTPVTTYWPVIAESSVRLPPNQRWADRLACEHVSVKNEIGEVVGQKPRFQTVWCSEI